MAGGFAPTSNTRALGKGETAKPPIFLSLFFYAFDDAVGGNARFQLEKAGHDLHPAMPHARQA